MSHHHREHHDSHAFHGSKGLIMAEEIMKPASAVISADNNDELISIQPIGREMSHSTHHHDMSMMPMMSLGLVNFPVAFFSIFEIWQFVFLVTICFLVSFLVEFARVRNAIGNLSSMLEIIKSRKVLPTKRYQDVLRRNSLENNIDDSTSQTKLHQPDVKKRKTHKRALKAKLQRDDQLNNAVEIIPGGFGVRVFQLAYQFVMVFSHYALMMAAMANLWVMMFVCAGAAFGYLFGTWCNDRSRNNSCCSSAVKNAGRNEKLQRPPKIKIDDGSSSDSSDSEGDNGDNSEAEDKCKSAYYAVTVSNENLGSGTSSAGPFCH